MKPSFSIGIEEEYQTIDPATYDLRSHIQTELMAQGRRVMKEKVKSELHQAVVEVGTGVCRNMAEAREDLMQLRRQMVSLAGDNGLALVAGATHPFADWRVQDISPDERYLQVVEDMQLVARANLIFGLHVHVGIEDRETAIHLMNQVRYFLPHLLALSTNSPFWLGMNTGLKSYRCKVFDKFPRTNIPDTFTSWADYESFVNLLIRTNCIDNAKKIWWDVRCHPFFDTVEVRICDMTTRLDDTLAIAALIQALMGKLYLLYRRNQAWRDYSHMLIEENKWRAVRYGLDGQLIDFGKREQVPTRVLVEELLDFVSEAADIFHTQDDLDRIRALCQEGTSADRQLRVFKETGNMKAVVDDLAEQTLIGC